MSASLNVYEKRPKDLGYLFVLGGPGGSGSSTIAISLAKKYGLSRVYGGAIMRSIAKSKGYKKYVDFIESDEFNSEQGKFDHLVDRKLIAMALKPNILIESKIVGPLLVKEGIESTVKIWLDCSIETRVYRKLFSKGLISEGESLDKKSILYIETRNDLMIRYSNDKNRYQKIYGISYSEPELYYDIILKTDNQTPSQTFNLLLKKIEDGGYLKKHQSNK
ncbi:MAG TPA: hypothetical protein ENN64_00430 [bacterium]|mgnify:CR=1 FL=1|nr:hypothetical protein [bacterium]